MTPRRSWTLVAVALVGGLAAVTPLVYLHLTERIGYRLVDLAVYRDAGWSVLLGRPLYEHVTAPPQLLPFTYPPFAALLAVPLASITFFAAGVVWTAGLLALTGLLSWWGFRRLLPRAGRWWPVALAVLAVAVQWTLPFRDEVKFGQVDTLVAALCVADCLTRRPRWPRGLLIGLATAIKLTPGVFVVYLWLTGRRRAAAVSVAAFAGATLLAAAVLPADSHRFWFDAVLNTNRVGANWGTSNQSLRGILLRTPLPAGFPTALWLLSAAAVAYVGYRRAVRAYHAGDHLAATAIVGLLAVLLSPVAWIHHLAWLPLAFGAILDDGRNRRRVAWAFVAWALFVVKVPWYGASLLGTDVPHAIGRLLQDSYGLAAVAMVCWLPVRGAGRGRVGGRRTLSAQWRRPEGEDRAGASAAAAPARVARHHRCAGAAPE